MLEKVHQANLESRREFIATIAHELKTPLTALTLRHELAEKKLKAKDQENYEFLLFLENSKKDWGRLSRLVEELVDVLNLADRDLPLFPEFFDLEEELEIVLGNFQKEFQLRNIPFTFSLNAPVLVYWDKSRMRQVFAHLLSNASTHCAGAPVTCQVDCGGGNVFIEIADRGPGITKKKQEKIFECFERGSGTSQVRGLGFGLYISREILSLHDGKIGLQSETGHGSNFKLTLPVRPSFEEKSSYKP